MIHRTALSWHTESWQEALKNLIRSPEELFELLQLNSEDLHTALEACGEFELRVPRSFVARMEIGNPNDPLLKQVLPTGRELLAEPGYSQDPLAEQAANPHPGLIHKYQGRVLLVVTGSCTINCRYCFRRHFPYQDNRPSRETWLHALEYIARDDSINEVIFSGGDPLNAPDSTLHWLSSQIAQIPHITRLRVHSRLPIVVPARITDSCLDWMASDRFNNVLVIHANHVNEINADVAAALARLKSHGVTLLNQTVLLKGINNNAQTLIELSERLFQCGVIPYYLHMLDKVQGAAHFDVDQTVAQTLLRTMRESLPGYLVPKLVREIAGEPSKTPIL